MKSKLLSFLVVLLLYATQGNATITKTIGSTGDYPSITAAWAAIPGIESPITQPWIFELKSDYNTVSETFPISLTAIAGASATNTITIRPQAGASGINISTGTASEVFQLNGVDYLIIDGRLGGIGARDLTIENTQTTANKHAITLTADATNNTIKYCNVLGSSYVANAGAMNPQTNAVININDSGSTTNCDNTTISNCFISKSGINHPACLIGISGSSAIAVNDLSIMNNEFSDFNMSAFYAAYPLSNLIISGNSIYQTATWATNYSSLYGVYALHGSNGNITITDNYIGGGAANCGGSAMTISCTNWNRPFSGYKVSSFGGSCTISGNYFQNITTSGGGNELAGNYLIDIDGTSSYQIGTSGNGNTFGSMTGTGSLATTGGETTGYNCIYVRGSGNVSAVYNNYGAVNIGSNSNYSGRSYLKGMNIEGTANCTFSNNTFGNSTADNLAHTLNGVIYFFYSSSTGNYTVSDNTIQNIKVVGFTGTNLSLIYLNGNGNLTADNNSFSNISNASNSQAYFFRVNTSGTATITNNIIGSTAINNISNPSGNRGFTVFLADGGGTFVFSNNIFQQATQSGSSTGLYGVSVTSGTLTSDNNIFRNLTYTGTGGSVIYTLNSSSSNHSITNNIIQDCSYAGTFNAISANSSGTTTITGNTIGGSTSGNMIISGAGQSSGITVSNLTGVFNISGNSIRNFNCTDASSSNKFNGIYVANGTAAITQNTIRNISSASTSYLGTGIGAPTEQAIVGIYIETGGNIISQNTILDLITTGIGTTFYAYDLSGIFVDGNGTNMISKNFITGLGAAGSEQTSVTGINLRNSSDNNLYNNVILLDNGAYSTVGNELQGIYNGSTGTNVFYHNTVKIFGSKTSQNAATYCLRSSSSSSTDLQNNLFQNTRSNSGGSGTNYTVNFSGTPSPLINNYNYLQASGTGGSVGTVSANNNTGTTLNLDALGVPINPTSSDVQNTGTNLTSIVPDDFNGTTRNNPNPWRGAYESLPNPGTDSSVTICASTAPFNLFDDLGGNPSGGGTWSGPSTVTGGDLGTFDPSVNTAGVYTYTNGGSSANVTVTINAAPTVASITGATEVCEGSTITLSDATAGGTWSSSTTTVATIDVFGVITGVTSGTSDITYSVTSGGCTTDVTITITVDAPPTVDVITGTTNVCIGSTITLSDVTAGGTWSSASTSIATIDASGVVTGVAAGTSVIMYTVTSGACTASQTTTVTVNGPVVELISGATEGCVGSTVMLTDATGGGTWSSTTTSVATVDASGVVTGISAGSSVITYSVTSGECTTSQTTTVTFSTIPFSPTVSNDANYCSSDVLNPMTASASGTGMIIWFSDQQLTTQISTGTSLIPNSTAGTTTYYVVEDNNGCLGVVDSIEITIENCDLIIPTAFSPDGDNINEKWILEGIDALYPNNVVKIYNRWGGLLFESEKGLYEQSSWDGRFKGEDMPTASYYFIIEFNDESTEDSNGTVTILRKQ